MTDLARLAQPLPPIKLGHFTLTEGGVKVVGVPTRADFLGTFDFVVKTHKASGWWVVDMIAYAAAHPEIIADLDNEVDPTMFPEGTLRRYQLLAREFPPLQRLPQATMAHHLEALVLPEEERTAALVKAVEHGWSTRDLREHIRVTRRQGVLQGQASLVGKYRVILADPPWPYRDSGATEDGSLGKAERHYAPLSIEALCALPVIEHALPNSVLFLWVTTPMLLLSPGPIDVIAAWGFDYKSELVWDKVLGMPGHYGLHVTHEHLVIATRGQGGPDVPTPEIKSILVERRSKVHSGKPESVRRWIESRWTTGPYLELFARTTVEHWDAYGDQLPPPLVSQEAVS